MKEEFEAELESLQYMYDHWMLTEDEEKELRTMIRKLKDILSVLK